MFLDTSEDDCYSAGVLETKTQPKEVVAMNDKHHVRNILKSWKDTGTLEGDRLLIEQAISYYESLLESCTVVPGCEMLITQTSLDLDSLRRIYKARYNK